MSTASKVINSLKELSDPKKAAFFPKFFKTGPGQYGEGDKFMGISVPQIRSVVKEFRDLPLPEVAILLASPWHEARLLGALILVDQFRRSDAKGRAKLHTFYVKNLKGINNWDIVDSSAPDLVGKMVLETGDAAILKKLASSKKLWSERVAVVATLALIRAGKFQEVQDLSIHFINHPHDLMHKAVGWMLREMGKKDEVTLKKFLDRYAGQLPRTALRYSIERLSEKDKKKYMTMKRSADRQ